MASRDPEEGATNLLRQSLRDWDDGCPGPDILAAYFEGSLDEQQSARYDLHLSHCSRCREQLAALDRASAPATAGGRQPHGFWHWAWLWDWRWLAPLTAVLVFAAVWMVRQPRRKQADKSQQLVAMSQPQAPAASPGQEDRSAPNAVPSARLAPRAAAPLRAKETETDSLERKSQTAARDFGTEGSNLTPPPTVSRNTTASREPAPPASENGAASALGGNPRQVMTTSQAETIAPQPSPMEMKSNPASAAARLSAQRAKTDAGVPPQALTVEAVARHPIVRMIATPDPKVVWRIGAGGSVERSEDGGASWHGQLPDASAQLTAGSAPSETICWLVGRDGVIFLTTNAKDWKRIRPPVPADFVAITAEGVSAATVTTADGRRFTTSDGGIHWNPAL